MGKYCIDELPNRLEDGKLRECLIASNNGDENARSELIIHNLKLVIKMIEKYLYYVPYNKEDLFEVGVIGLIKSIDNFDLTKDNSFTSFASKCILNEIKMYMRKER